MVSSVLKVRCGGGLNTDTILLDIICLTAINFFIVNVHHIAYLCFAQHTIIVMVKFQGSFNLPFKVKFDE